MQKIRFFLFYFIIFTTTFSVGAITKRSCPNVSALIKSNPVVKKVLDNGLTVLVRPTHHVPRVLVQMWYHVGSKDEQSFERGKAHMLEHMIFKGTDKLSESDIPLITNKLSGYCNAGTIYDYTKYDFELPSCHWQYALQILADCMRNCTFKDDMINSEVKAVIQELKMLKDNYRRTLLERMKAAIFEDHPYHYPIVGYKQDLWNMNSKSLHDFYKKHYVPNNATLVVVGDVDPDEVISLAKKYFGSITKAPDYKKQEYYYNKDISSKSVILYRDVHYPAAKLIFVVPGVKDQQDYPLLLISAALGAGRSSRLYQKLVEELRVVTHVKCSVARFFDHSLFVIDFDPKKDKDIDHIIELIQGEVKLLAEQGLAEREIYKVINNVRKDYCDILESNMAQAELLGKFFLATEDENYIFKLLDFPVDQVNGVVKEIATQYLRPSLMHKGLLLPLDDQEKKYWIALQEESDQEDQKILSARVRESDVEQGRFVETVQASIPDQFEFPKATKESLSNGIKVFSYHRPDIPKVDIILELKAKDYSYDPEDKQGLYQFMTALLDEGTKKHSAKELAELLEYHGIDLHISPGKITLSVLSEELELALELLAEILSSPAFTKDDIEKIRAQLMTIIESQADDPEQIAQQLIDEHLFAGHPFAKKEMGDKESIGRITRKDIVNFYKKVISPDGARLAVVGDYHPDELKDLFEQTIGKWKGKRVKEIEYPECKYEQVKQIKHYLNRDQVYLCYAGLSVDRMHVDFDKLFIFNSIFSGDMNSRLFRLREQTGIFYVASGAAVTGATHQPGRVFVQALVSCDRLDEAEKILRKEIDEAADSITENEFEQAKQNVVHSLVRHFATNRGIAGTFLFLDRYGFGQDYYDNRAQSLNSIGLQEMKVAVKKVLRSDCMMTVKVGRI